jgi:hypothetical protein
MGGCGKRRVVSTFAGKAFQDEAERGREETSGHGDEVRFEMLGVWYPLGLGIYLMLLAPDSLAESFRMIIYHGPQSSASRYGFVERTSSGFLSS